MVRITGVAFFFILMPGICFSLLLLEEMSVRNRIISRWYFENIDFTTDQKNYEKKESCCCIGVMSAEHTHDGLFLQLGLGYGKAEVVVENYKNSDDSWT